MSDLKVAVVGLGAFGRRYAASLRSMHGVEVSWGVDLDEANRVGATGLVGRTTTALEEVLADDTVSAVFVVTPEAAHRDIAVRALDAGKDVVVEKPLATREDDAIAMIDAAERSGRRLLPAFLLRFDYRYAQLKERLGDLGPVRNMYAYRNFDRGLFRLYSRTHSFIENAIHDIDLMLWYTGSEVVAAHGYTRSTLGLEHPDVNWGVLELADGSIGVLQTSWLYPEQRHEDLQWNAGIQVMTDRGVLEVSNDQRGLIANTADAGILLLDQTGWADLHGESRGAFGAMLRHVVSCLRGDTRYVGTTPHEALASMRAAQMLVSDAASRRAPEAR